MYQYILTPKDIYLKDVEDIYIPPIYNIVGFRVPAINELFVSSVTKVVQTCIASFNITGPRLIVVPKPKRKVITFTETGEIRQVKQGEFFLNKDSKFDEWDHSQSRPSMGSYPIYTRTESEI